MVLKIFQGTTLGVTLSNASKLGLNDYGTGNGSDQDFTLVKNTYADLGNMAQGGDSDFYYKSTGTLTGSGSNAHVSTPPASGEKLVFPSSSAGVLRAYDQPPYAQDAYKIYAVGDIDDIADYQYLAAPAASGIRMYFTNNITEETVAMPGWYQFAPLNVSDMTVGSYGASGEPFELTADLIGFNTLADSASATATTIILNDATDFVAGQFVMIGSTDICWVTEVNSDTLTLLQPLSFSHSASEAVYACAAGFAIKVNIPTGISGGVAKDWVNLSLDVDYQAQIRI